MIMWLGDSCVLTASLLYSYAPDASTFTSAYAHITSRQLASFSPILWLKAPWPGSMMIINWTELVIFYFHVKSYKCTEKASICRHILNNKNIIAKALKKYLTKWQVRHTPCCWVFKLNWVKRKTYSWPILLISYHMLPILYLVGHDTQSWLLILLIRTNHWIIQCHYCRLRSYPTDRDRIRNSFD